MTMKKILKLTLAAALGSPLLLASAGAADKDEIQARPADPPSQPQQPPQRRRLSDMPPPTPEQLREAEAFAEKNSPNRYHAFKRFAEASNNQENTTRMRMSIVRGLLEMQALGREDNELYDMKLEEMRLDDQIFGAVAEYRKRVQNGEQVSRADLRDQIKPQFKELLALRVKQAEHRIKKMETALADEQSRLERLKKVSDEGLSARLEQEIESGGVFTSRGFGPPGSTFAPPGRFREGSPPPATSP
jgi:hypothetical protein